MPESAPLIGLGADKKKVSVDLDHDSPHVLISAGTGGGKSTILRCVCCQFIHHGALAVLDCKRISHTWARGVPGVTYCRDIAEIHNALIQLVQEGRRRIRLAEQLGDDVLEKEPWRVGPRLVILLEEVNATMAQLKRSWQRIRESGDPKVSPAVDALAEVLFMGRAVRLHVLLVAQSATARAIGGPQMRENFAARILVRYILNATPEPPPAAPPAPTPDDAVVELRTAQVEHLPQLTLAALRWARANDRTSRPRSTSGVSNSSPALATSSAGRATGLAPCLEPPTSADRPGLALTSSFGLAWTASAGPDS